MTLAFMIAGLILAVTPGPAVIYIVTRTYDGGRKAGLASVGGIALGNLGNAAAASVGLAAIFAASATAFVVIKMAGAAYLVFLGIQALRTRPAAVVESARPPPARFFRDGFFVALFNPKTALFFGALLPQFMNPGGSALAQSLVLGGTFVAIALCTDTLYVLCAAALAARIRRGSAWRHTRYLSAASFMGLGVYAALGDLRPTR